MDENCVNRRAVYPMDRFACLFLFILLSECPTVCIATKERIRDGLQAASVKQDAQDSLAKDSTDEHYFQSDAIASSFFKRHRRLDQDDDNGNYYYNDDDGANQDDDYYQQAATMAATEAATTVEPTMEPTVYESESERLCKQFLFKFLEGTTDAHDECEGVLNAYTAAGM